MPEMLDPDEFDRRGAERRERRVYPKRPDLGSVIVGGLLLAALGFWIVWGVKA